MASTRSISQRFTPNQLSLFAAGDGDSQVPPGPRAIASATHPELMPNDGQVEEFADNLAQPDSVCPSKPCASKAGSAIFGLPARASSSALETFNRHHLATLTAVDTVASALGPCAIDAGMQEVAAKDPAAGALACEVEANPVTSASDAPSWVMYHREPELPSMKGTPCTCGAGFGDAHSDRINGRQRVDSGTPDVDDASANPNVTGIGVVIGVNHMTTRATPVASVAPTDPSLFEEADVNKRTAVANGGEGLQRMASAMTARISEKVLAAPIVLVIAGLEQPSAQPDFFLDEFAKLPKKPTFEQLKTAEPHRPLTAREETEADPNLDIRSSKRMRMSKEEPRFAKGANVRNVVTYSGGVLSNAKPLCVHDYASLGNVATRRTSSGTCASGLTNNLPDSLPKSSLIKSGLADERGEPSSVSLGNRDSLGATDQPEEPSDMSPRAPLNKFSYEELERLCLLQKNSGRNLAFLRGLRRHLDRDGNCGAKGDLECDDVIADYINSKSVVSHHNLRCALRFVRRLVVTQPEDGFQQLIDYAITRWRGAGGTIQGLANEIGLDKQRLTAYARSNARPKPQSLDGLTKLEKLSELPSGSLTKYARTSNTGHVFGQFDDLSNPLYSWRPIFRKLATLGPNLIDQLQRYCAFKTSKLHRQRIDLPDGSSRKVARVGAWTPSLGTFDPPNCGKSFEEWRNFSTVTPFVTVVRTVYTYARSHHAVDCDTMAILMDIELIGEMLAEDVQLRGAFHSGHEVIIVTLASLMHPKHGYLTQLPEIFCEEARSLGMNVELKDWASFIAEKYAAVQQLAASLAPNRVRGRRSLRSRDKKKKLSAFLNCDDAYGTHVFPALLRMEEERPPRFAPNSVRLDYEVSLLTFVLFAACPLRKLNWVTAEWDKNLRRDKGGSWWVHVPLDQLKNRRFLDQDLDLILPNWAAERVEYYYQNVREWMTSVNANASRYVMAGPNISAKRRKPGKRGRLPPTALIYSVVGRRMNRMTKRIWNLSLSPHDWRDIFATDYLHKHNDSLMTVAMILNDKPETILAEYAKPSSIRFSKLAAKIMDQEYKLAVEARRRILTRGSMTMN